jgi:acetyl-CoA C-acetyltransferase
VEDVFIGCGIPEGASGWNVGRNTALWAGCPVTTSGVTINRFCSSGLQAVAMASHAVLVEGSTITVGGGVDSLSLCYQAWTNGIVKDPKLVKEYPSIWMPMIDTADNVAKKYNVSRADLDAYALQSQMRCAEAQAAGRFADEIVPMTVTMKNVNKDTKEVTYSSEVCDRDDCNKADTTLAGLAKLKAVMADKDPLATTTAGNASQLSDGGAANLVMEGREVGRFAPRALEGLPRRFYRAGEESRGGASPPGGITRARRFQTRRRSGAG